MISDKMNDEYKKMIPRSSRENRHDRFLGIAWTFTKLGKDFEIKQKTFAITLTNKEKHNVLSMIYRLKWDGIEDTCDSDDIRKKNGVCYISLNKNGNISKKMQEITGKTNIVISISDTLYDEIITDELKKLSAIGLFG